ncbi:protein FAM204A [Ambystoma mexicanum]|uniref:protein FAM204A n=1 Tax=Ambystoma mexicanum TaxID=8296 RepID=UPI0037E964EA
MRAETMWSGLLPEGVRESDDEEEEEEPGPSFQNVAPHEEAEVQPAVAYEGPPADPGACPSGVSANMWAKFQELQKKNIEMKTQTNLRDRPRRRKHRRKAKSQGVQRGESESQPSTDDAPLEELKQFFGINDRFKPPVSNKILQKSGLESSIERAVNEGDIAKAEELSDKLATREMGVKITKAVACRNFVIKKQEDLASQEARKKKKLAWGFEAKQRWETKSNMGYM